jgi:glycosyltransferase involved in cell wall biosynthesis
MLYVFVNYNYSPDYTTPESWFKRIAGYNGLVEELAKTNEVISIKQINYEGRQIHNGVDYRFLDCGKKKTFFPRKLNRYVKSLKPDVVFVQGLHQPLQLIQLGTLLRGKSKIIAQHHAEQPFTGIKKLIQRFAGRYVNAYLFAATDLGLDWVKKGNISSGKKIHEVMEVSSNFYVVDKIRALQKTGVNGSLVFLWVGRLNANKDPLTVVKAFLLFAEKVPSARLYMIYHTDELLGQLKTVLNNAANKQAVVLIGKTPHEDLLYWYNCADFIISGSHYEGSGTAICEAMSCGCVPVVTGIFSFRMITDNGNCGLLYEPGDQNGLLSALMRTCDLNMEQQRAKSLNQFESKLSFPAIARQVQQIAGSL